MVCDAAFSIVSQFCRDLGGDGLFSDFDPPTTNVLRKGYCYPFFQPGTSSVRIKIRRLICRLLERMQCEKLAFSVYSYLKDIKDVKDVKDVKEKRGMRNSVE